LTFWWLLVVAPVVGHIMQVAVVAPVDLELLLEHLDKIHLPNLQ
jgi:hypothetical protein